MQDKIDMAVKRIQEFAPDEGYYLAFSGGKDSIVCKKLLEISGVKFDSHYNLTTVDPPELVNYIKKEHPDVIIEYPKETMWELIERRRMPPTRLARYCCASLKEGGGEGRFVVTGVRWAESPKRKNKRKEVEFFNTSRSKRDLKHKELFLMSDNESKRRLIETCMVRGKYILNPIIDWSDDDVWRFIRQYHLSYCTLYDQGYLRLGCIGCPQMGAKKMKLEFERYPKYRKAYIKAFDRMVVRRKNDGLKTDWKDGEDVMKWWLSS